MSNTTAKPTSSAHWSFTAISRLRDARRCPVCRSADLHDALCPSCGAVLGGDSGIAVWQASERAAHALGELSQVLQRVPRVDVAAKSPVAATATTSAPTPALSRPSATSATSAASATPRTSTTLQSVLAIAGAGLIATAAMVFTFLNPDLTDPLARGVVVAIATLLFGTAAPLLHRAGLRFSAECVGALALIFATLSTVVLAELLSVTSNPWWFAAGATLLGGIVVLSLGLLTRLRVWMLAASTSLTLVSALSASAVGGEAATVLGPLGTAVVALLLLEGRRGAQRRVGNLLTVERRILLAVLVIALAVMTVSLTALTSDSPLRWLATGAALLAAALLTAGAAAHGARRTFSVLSGAIATAAIAVATLAALPEVSGGLLAMVGGSGALTGGSAAWIVTLPAGAGAALLTLGLITRARGRTRRSSVLTGSLATVLLIVVPHAALAGLGAFGALIRVPQVSDFALEGGAGVAVVGGLVVTSSALALHATVLRCRSERATRVTLPLRALSLALLAIAAVGALALSAAPLQARLVTGIVLITATALMVSARGRGAHPLLRLPIVVAAHAALAIVVALSWQTVGTAVGAAPAVLVALAALARCVPPVVRAGHVAVGTAYGLIVVGSGLGMLGLDTPAQISITATVGLLVAIAATLAPRLAASWWIAVLVVSTVPFALAVGLVAVERNGWSALSTSTMLVLAVCLLGTRRPGLGIVVRSLAAAVIVPAIAVVLVDLGAVLLASSGSPVVLPIIAGVVAAAVMSLNVVDRFLRGRGMPAAHTRAVRAAIEASSLLTAVIAISLALDRPAAGMSTTLLVLAVLAAGLFRAAAIVGAVRLWWLGGAAATGAVWSLWALLGVTSIEAHVLPPALGVALVGAVLTARGRPEPELVGVGLIAAIAPLVAALALASEPAPLRAVGLVLSAVALVVLVAGIHRGTHAVLRRLQLTRGALLMAAIGAASAASVQAVRLGLTIDISPVESGLLMPFVLGIALGGAMPAAAAGLLLAAPSRYGLVPALVFMLVPAWVAIAPNWVSIWAVWALMLALLTLMVVAAHRHQHRISVLPPVWLLFGFALATAIAAWSPRELRVEWFSIPLGLMLLAAGATALRNSPVGPTALTGTALAGTALAGTAPPSRQGVASWPRPGTGSWQLLAPGIVVLVLASMLATVTDPQTWRAVLVMALALTAILVGARWRLAAPFVLGIVVLPVENVVAFSVQIGRGIDAMPWWITLAVAGLVLLVIAVGFERRAGDDASLAARVRDLR